MTAVKEGQVVTFRCSSFLEDGSCLDEVEDQKPISMKAGRKLNDPIPKVISKALIGMTANETKSLKVPPDMSFGQHDPKKIFKLDLEFDDKYEVGQSIQLKIKTRKGEEILDGVITEVGGEYAKVDTNHPLAGKTIVLKIHVLSIDK